MQCIYAGIHKPSDLNKTIILIGNEDCKLPQNHAVVAIPWRGNVFNASLTNNVDEYPDWTSKCKQNALNGANCITMLTI